MVAQEDAKALLRDGIDIAKSGDRRLAHTLLAQATRLDPQNERAWLWLAGVAHDSNEAVDCLQHVLKLNPDSQAAVKGLACLGIKKAEISSLVAASSTPDLDSPAYHEAVTVRSHASEKRLKASPFAPTTPTNGRMQFQTKRPDLNPKNESNPPSTGSRSANMTTETDAVNTMDATNSGDPSKTTARVLVVDDSPTIRKLVAMTLGKRGFEVVAAADGMEALARINDGAPDLILLDITMPRMDGYQLCRTIKGNHTIDHIPIVMLTGKDGFMDKVRGRMVGSEGYLTKPFQPDELVRMVEQHVRRF
ncbi:MAG: response regulator [Anaerolineales bacterium]|jgi:twitching motility two-component system response regulator PilG